MIGGKEKGGSLCGDRSGEVTLMAPEPGRDDVKIVVMTQSEKWRYNNRMHWPKTQCSPAVRQAQELGLEA